MRLLIRCLSALCWGALPGLLQAQSAVEGAQDRDLEDLRALLNQTIVTADRGGGEERSVAAADTTVIEREQIALHGWRSLAEVLANVPGLYVVDDLVLPSVSVRGVTGGLKGGTRIIKVMIDGVPVSFRPDLAAFIGPELIPMEAVSRIEIARGPLSALYGANAFLAVVNVITVQPAAGVAAEAAVRGALVLGHPGYGVSGMVQEAGPAFFYWLAASHDLTDRSGLSLHPTFAAQDASLPRYAGLFGRASVADLSTPTSVAGALGFGDAARAGKLTVRGGLQQLDSMGEFQPGSVLTHQTRVALENLWSSARYEKDFTAHLTGWADLGFSEGAPTRDDRFYLTNNDNFYYRSQSRYSAWDLDLGVSYDFGPRISLRAGLDAAVDHETVAYYSQVLQSVQGTHGPGSVLPITNSDEALHQDLNDLGVYLQATSVPLATLPGLHLVGNVRVDKPNLFELQTSWRAGAAYRVSEGLTTKLFAGRAFQAPSGLLLFAQPAFGNGDILGSRSVPGLAPLVPQVIQSLELALAGTVGSHLSAELGLYGQALDQRISFRPNGTNYVASNGLQGDTGVNASQQENLGAELSVNASFGHFAPYLLATVQQTFLGGAPSLGPPPLYPNEFGRVGMEVSFPLQHLLGTVQARVVGPRGASDSNVYLNNNQAYTLAPYASVDLAVSVVDLHPFGSRSVTRVRVSVSNLLDDRHFEPGSGGIDIPNLGRAFSLELRQSL